MNITHSILTTALMATPGLALAQGFEGAELSASIGTHTSGGYEFANYDGGIQFGIGAGVSVELDFRLRDWRGYAVRGSTATLHGIYEITPDISAGLYYGRERVTGGSGSAVSYGIEGATRLGSVDLAGYLGQIDDQSFKMNAIGLDATMPVGNSFAVTGGIDSVSGNLEFSTMRIGGEYRFSRGPTAFAAIGRETSGSTTVDFVSIGARIALGDGVTFGNRSLLESLPLP